MEVRGNEMWAPFGLIKIANEIAGNIANERNVLRSRRDDLSKQLADVEKQLESITDANSRASNYHSITTVEGYNHCPNCWIRHLSKSPLIVANRDDEEEKNPNEDILTCHTCRMDFAINEEGEWRVR
jgi:hypothetical protein